MINVMLKGVLGVTVMMWVRWTLPRLRIDQVMTTCLKYCVPIAAVMFLGATLWQVSLPRRAVATHAAGESRRERTVAWPRTLQIDQRAGERQPASEVKLAATAVADALATRSRKAQLAMDAIYWHSFFFLLFALLACGFAVAVVLASNIVRMAFYLVLSLAATAGLFFLAGADFVGAMQLMIYVGGTLVLLVFGVMLTSQDRSSR